MEGAAKSLPSVLLIGHKPGPVGLIFISTNNEFRETDKKNARSFSLVHPLEICREVSGSSFNALQGEHHPALRASPSAEIWRLLKSAGTP